jgi:hypothetical protein
MQMHIAYHWRHVPWPFWVNVYDRDPEGYHYGSSHLTRESAQCAARIIADKYEERAVYRLRIRTKEH